MKEYKITKERLEAMAKNCPEAKEVLKEGFPEAFEKEEEWIDITRNVEFSLDYTGQAYWIDLRYEGRILSYFGYQDVARNFEEKDFKVERVNDALRILKRRSK